MQKKNICIVNKLGLHARAAAAMVQTASAFCSEVTISCNGETVNGKSIMGVMMLAAAQGTTVEIATIGSDETAAMAEIEILIANRFGEDA